MSNELKITRDLKLVFPVETESNGAVYAYSLPLSRLLFEQYVMELGETYSACFGGYDPKHVAMTAPQMAYPALKATATKRGTWDGPSGVENGLINELSRLTTIAHASKDGWQQIPLQTALTREILDEDSHAEVLSSLVFFTLACRVGPRALLHHSMQAAGSPRDWRHTSLNFTAWLLSLKPSKPAAPTTKKPSSVIG